MEILKLEQKQIKTEPFHTKTKGGLVAHSRAEVRPKAALRLTVERYHWLSDGTLTGVKMHAPTRAQSAAIHRTS
eukprot:914223-Amphidinium_carterae.1